MKKILITGGTGRLGRAMKEVFKEALFPARKELDIKNRNQAFDYIKKNRPNIIIHLAAKASIPQCEEDKKDAWETNVKGVSNIIDAINTFCPDCYLLYCSTACVFRGDKGNYNEKSIPDPCSYYGLTKLIGESEAKRVKNYLIFRTNFVPRETWDYPKAFSDRYGTYLFADDLARAIKDVMSRRITGLIHICGDKKISMLELARITTPNVKKITLEEYKGPTLARDMSLISIRIKPYKLNKKGYK